MKIPETTTNVGAYYGNEEDGQWQPNGVIIDGGVGGGVVGSGDAGVHRPSVYPVHIPRGHMPAGYVMTGAYYPPAPYAPVPAPAQDDFEDYMWMENEEEFDKQVMQQLEEEALMEQCIEAMLEDEQRERNNRPPVANGHNHHYPTTSNGAPSLSLEETVSRSTLNPLAAEFVPTRVRQPPPHSTVPEEKQVSQMTEATTTLETIQKTKEEVSVRQPVTERKLDTSTEVKAETTEENKPEEPVTPPKDPPEVSAADVQPIQESKPTDKKHREVKREPRPAKAEAIASTIAKKTTKVETNASANVTAKVVKMEPKVKKPLLVKSETEVTPKKKEIKAVKSEGRLEDKVEEVVVPVVEVPKQPSPQVEEPIMQNLPSLPSPPSTNFGPVPSVPTTTGPKPINYAAAAKTNKPKKPTTAITIPVEKTIQPIQKKVVEKKKLEKPPVQRKNSAK